MEEDGVLELVVVLDLLARDRFDDNVERNRLTRGGRGADRNRHRLGLARREIRDPLVAADLVERKADPDVRLVRLTLVLDLDRNLRIALDDGNRVWESARGASPNQDRSRRNGRANSLL